MNRAHELLRRRGHEPNARTDGSYQGFIDSDGHPQMGFRLQRANGAMDAFFYHNLDNLDLRIIRGIEYLNFTHRGKAVTLQGAKLEAILKAMMQHTLVAIVEHDGQGTEVDENGTVVTRAAVSMLSLDQQSAALLAEDQAEEMQPRWAASA